MLQLLNITRTFEAGGEKAGVFDVSLDVPSGQMTVLAGPSGSGKTTLLQIAGLLDEADSGDVRLEGVAVSALPERARTDLRLNRLGFVFQAHNLLPVLTALENVMLPLQLRGLATEEARAEAEAALASVDLTPRLHHRPTELSGGQQQRVAIARALAGRPAVVLADEPTASLDQAHGAPLMDLVHGLAKERGVAFLVASHDPMVIARADRVARLVDGRLVGLEVRP
ncbi:MAG TPA: ABC transporter ATP-binding protein [Holophagaceae bacterium]|nr:ABC transporter ATP-binding protein [Holophagaceae bacterium]